MLQRINQAMLPAQLPEGWPKWLSSSAQWVLYKKGWLAEGQMVAAPKVVLSVAPHTSNWDFVIGVLVIFAMRMRVSFLGKHTLFKRPHGAVFRRLGGIPINRARSAGVVEQIARKIKEEEHLVLAVTPEGTRAAVFPWRTGFLRIAQAAEIPVQCVGFDYARKRVIFGPVVYVRHNIEEQMQTIYGFYANVSAKYPQNLRVTEPERD